MTKVVFGYMPSYNSGRFMMIAALAEVVEGRLVKVEDALTEFPTRGEVLVPQKFIPEAFDRLSAGLWEVQWAERRNEDDDRNDRFAHFVAVKDHAPPHEVFRVDCHSEDDDAAREILTRGLQLPYRLTAEPLVEFTDGVVAGPMRYLPLQDGFGFRCPDNAFDHPIRAWSHRGSLDALDIPNHVRTRSFVSRSFIRKAETYVDLYPMTEAIRGVIKYISKEGPGTYAISKKEQELLADKLSANGLPEWVEARRDRILRMMKLSVEIPKQLDSQVELLLAHPKIEERLKLEEKRAFDAGKQSLELQEDGLRQRVAALAGEEQCLKQRLDKLNASIKDEEERGLRQAEKLEQSLIARALKAKEDVGALLAEIAVLQPFLSAKGAPLPTPTGSPGGAPAVRASAPTQTPKSFLEAVGVLRRNFTTLGLIPISARAFARDVMAAVCSGQFLMFRGSLGSLVARAVARSLACERVNLLQIPVGFAEVGGLETHLQLAVGGEACSAFIIEGANRACVDAYGVFLTEVITERAFGLGDPLPNLILLGTILEGPSALPPGPELTSLGPIFHTDCLAWESASQNIKLVDGQLTAVPALPRSFSDAERMVLSKWRKAFGGPPNALWTKNVEAVYKGLGQRPEKGDYPTPNQSLSFGWLLPRAHALGVDLSANAELLSEVRDDEHVRSWLVDFLGLPQGSNP